MTLRLVGHACACTGQAESILVWYSLPQDIASLVQQNGNHQKPKSLRYKQGTKKSVGSHRLQVLCVQSIISVTWQRFDRTWQTQWAATSNGQHVLCWSVPFSYLNFLAKVTSRTSLGKTSFEHSVDREFELKPVELISKCHRGQRPHNGYLLGDEKAVGLLQCFAPRSLSSRCLVWRLCVLHESDILTLHAILAYCSMHWSG